MINYNKDFGNHSIEILAGTEAIDYRNDWLTGFRDQFPLENYDVLNAGSIANQQATGSASEWSLQSYFGRINYNFDNRYLFEANLRVDGSSRFLGNNKYGYFPSFSFGWRLSEEEFLSTATWINELKIRGSWGALGNQQIGTYPFASTVTMGQNYVLEIMFQP